MKGGFLMNPDAIFEKVKEVIVDQLGVEDEAVKVETSFIDDLGADSLDIVELIMALEEEFDLQIPDSEAEKIATVGKTGSVNTPQLHFEVRAGKKAVNPRKYLP